MPSKIGGYLSGLSAKAGQREVISRLMDRINISAEWRDPYDKVWTVCQKYYIGQFQESTNIQGSEGSSSGQVPAYINIVRNQVDTLFAGTTQRPPNITVFPLKEEDKGASEILQELVNHWWRRWNAQDPFRESALDAIKLGHGWLKVGWVRNTETVDITDSERESYVNERLEAAIAEDPLSVPFTEAIVAEAESSIVDITDEVVISEHPTLVRVPVYDVFVDPESTSDRDMGWIAMRTFRPIKEVKEDQNYNSKARNKVKATDRLSTAEVDKITEKEIVTLGSSWGQSNEDTEFDRVEVWEFHDIIEGTFCIFTEGAEGFLVSPRKSEWSNTPHGHPFVMIRSAETGDFYPQGDVEPLIPIQNYRNENRTLARSILKGQIPRMAVREEFMTEKVIRDLESPKPNKAIQVNAENYQLNEIMFPLPVPSVPSDIITFDRIYHDDVEAVSGVNDLVRGQLAGGRHTALETSIVNEHSTARLSETVSALQRAAGRVGHMFANLGQMFLESPDVVKITGPDGAQDWREFTPEEIMGDYLIEVEVDSMRPRDHATRRQEALQLIGILTPYIEGGFIQAQNLLNWFFNMYGVMDAKELIGEQQPPPPTSVEDHQRAQLSPQEALGVLPPQGGV